MNMVDDVRGVGVIKMMMVDDMGEGGVKNDQKSDDIICGQPLGLIAFYRREPETFADCFFDDI